VRAQCRRAQGDTAAADEDEKRFNAAAARTAWDYYLPGHTAGWNGDLDEAIRSYQAALRLQPNHYNSLFFLALRFNTDRINRRPEAVQLLRACAALRPDDCDPYMARTSCYRLLGQMDDALADIRQAIRLGPNFAGPHNNLAWFLATCPDPKLRDPARAVEAARKAVELAPQDSGTWNTLGAALYRAGDWKAAISALEKSVALAHDNQLAFNGFFLAMARSQLGQKGEARTWYDKAVAWMEKNAPRDLELVCFRAEAAALLGLADLPADVFAGP
jgi:Flp pilus assembly protein TadD